MRFTRVTELLSAVSRPTLSLEFYPPKDLVGFGVLGGAIERMKPVRTDFASCTYGAGGSRRDFSLAALELLLKMGFSPVIAHLTCVGSSRADLEETVARIHALGIRNIMALRGDPPQGEAAFVPAAGGFAHASDLVRLVKSLRPDMDVGVAGYPECHPESPDVASDIARLKGKVDAGADFVTTQLFYDTDAFLRFRQRAVAAGVAVPILAGLMPPTSLKGIERAVALSRVTVPDALRKALSEAADPEETGLAWLEGQIERLVREGVAGIHLYILNRARPLLHPRLARALSLLRGNSIA
ncbi:MAG: methylenetetrahydrofolate reductase [Kiritimatiellae bacterium]|nr:methylenetetrahydrofolate reductase [Kiritimatiellia bacterium]